MAKKKKKKKSSKNLVPFQKYRIGLSASGHLSGAIGDLEKGGFAAIAAQIEQAKGKLDTSLTALRPSANPAAKQKGTRKKGKKYLSIEAIPFGRTRPIYIGKMITADLNKAIKDLRKEVHGMHRRLTVISRAPDDSSATVRVY